MLLSALFWWHQKHGSGSLEKKNGDKFVGQYEMDEVLSAFSITGHF